MTDTSLPDVCPSLRSQVWQHRQSCNRLDSFVITMNMPQTAFGCLADSKEIKIIHCLVICLGVAFSFVESIQLQTIVFNCFMEPGLNTLIWFQETSGVTLRLRQEPGKYLYGECILQSHYVASSQI